MTHPRPRRCRLVIAGAGHGKTTALRRWFTDSATVWLSADADPQAAAEQLRAHAAASSLVLEDLPQLSQQQADHLLRTVDELAGRTLVALSSRWPLGAAAVRWHGRGLLTEVGPVELALSVTDVTDVLAAEYDIHDVDLAEEIHTATAGWPALVQLAAEMSAPNAGHGMVLATLAAPGGRLAGYITEEILDPLPADVLRVVRDVSELGPISVDLCQALGHRKADAVVRLLSRTGLLIAASQAADGNRTDLLVPVIAQVARHGRRRDVTRRIAALAAPWYAEHGPSVCAARAYHQAGNTADCVRIINEYGEAMLAGGDAVDVAHLLNDVPDALLTRRLRLLHGDALRTIGDVPGAAAAYASAANQDPKWDAAVAWRTGLVHYLRGDPGAALAAFARVDAPTEAANHSSDVAMLLAWRATAQLQIGESSAAAESAKAALRLAIEANHPVAQATAHISLALCEGIAGNPADSDEHYTLALRIAERTEDMVLLTRILTNQTYHLLTESRYAEGLTAAHRAAQCARRAGHTNLRSIAGCNEADALAMLGRYDEAVAGYDHVLALCRRMGSRRSASALLGLGDVHRKRGWREQARASYEEALRVAEESGNYQVQVNALAGLSRVVAADDPKTAAKFANLAVERASDKVIAPALLARGWVSLQAGDLAGASADAGQAATAARSQRDRAGLAESLELRAAAEPDAVRAHALLAEAHAIWSDSGATVDAARTLVTIGSLPRARTDDRLGALLATDVLVAAGVNPTDVSQLASGAAQPNPAQSGRRGEVRVKALGRFEVHLDGEAVPAAQWQSRKARDLLRILVARRGRPVPRSELCELLWPDDDPAKTGHRLSVLLSIVRGALDPYRLVAADHYVLADQACAAVDVTRLHIDVEDFLADVAHGRRLFERGELAAARALLTAAERGYRGDAFEDEPYSDWSTPLREEARSAFVEALRILAHACRAADDTGAAVGYLLRLLEKDPYDEAGHRALVETLVAGGQHGQARRAFTRYREAMASIGVREPDEGILRPRPTAAVLARP